jgi:rhamnosyltransferase
MDLKMNGSFPIETERTIKKSNPSIAVLLATFNGMPYLEEQIACIYAQLGVDVTIFVSDDMSSDGTWEFLNGIKDRDIHVLPRKKFGSGANNFFRLLCDVDIDRFDYIALSDQDDIWAPRKLSRAVSEIEKHGCGGYSSDLFVFDEINERAWRLKKSDAPVRFDYLFQGASAGCTYVLARKAAILVQEKIKPTLSFFPRDKSHDWLIYAICRSHGLDWHLDDEAHIFYRQHKSNAYGAMSGLEGVIERFRLARVGWYRQHILWLSQFLKNTKEEMSVLSAVERLNWTDRMWLVFQSQEFRRRKIDRYFLILALLTGWF